MLPQSKALFADAQIEVPGHPLVEPVLVPLLVGPGLDEELHLHLFELARAEDEVMRCDLVAERLALLCDPERYLLAGSLLNRGEVYEHPLRRFGTEVDHVGRVLNGTHMRLEHEVELPRLRPGGPLTT